jgi:hypothetical protein
MEKGTRDIQLTIMPSWTDYVGFGLGLLGFLGVLHLIAFIRPHGWVSRRLHPSFAANPENSGDKLPTSPDSGVGGTRRACGRP